MSTDLRDALYKLLESAEPSAEFKEGLKKLEKDLDTIIKNTNRVTKLLNEADIMKDEWKLEQEGMSFVVGLIAEKYDGFDEDNLDDLETEDADMLRHIFGMDIKKYNTDLDMKAQMWAMLLKDYQKREMEVLKEIEDFKILLEDEIAKSFVEKWKTFSKIRSDLKSEE